MVNNAGIAEYADVEKTDAEIWDKTIAVNLTGTMVMKLGIEAMKNNGEKNSIINMSSIEGLIGDPDLFVQHNASKGGVRLLTKSAALDCARKGYDIRVISSGLYLNSTS